MWWFNRVPRHLPEACGRYLPGCMDVMTEYSENGIFMRLYYPTDAVKDERNYKKWIPWLPDTNYIAGFSKVLLLPYYIIRFIFWWSGSHKIPVLYGEKPKTDNKLNCVILSHGLGGTRFLYSHFCCELASRGFLVIALEHRDHSGSYTYYYQSPEKAAKDIKTTIEYRQVDLGKEHYEKRNVQVRHRSQECSKAIDLLININKGNVPHNVLIDVPNNRNISFELSDLVGNLNLDTIAMAGHSFGGASALLTLSRRKELKQGVLLDPWMFPVKGEGLEEKLDQPLIFINTQTFHISTNVSAMSKLLSKDTRKMYTILHTTHENQTDTVLLIGYWLNWFMKKLNPLVALKINHSLVLRFLKDYIDIPAELTDCQEILSKQDGNIEFGLTRPWA